MLNYKLLCLTYFQTYWFLHPYLMIIITFYKGYELSLLYEDKRSGMIIISIGIVYLLIALFFFITAFYSLFMSEVHILSEEQVKLEGSIYVLIISFGTYFLSAIVRKIVVNQFLGKGVITLKQ